MTRPSSADGVAKSRVIEGNRDFCWPREYPTAVLPCKTGNAGLPMGCPLQWDCCNCRASESGNHGSQSAAVSRVRSFDRGQEENEAILDAVSSQDSSPPV